MLFLHPIYEVLKERGVHFHFFHKVEELSLSGYQLKICRTDQDDKTG